MLVALTSLLLGAAYQPAAVTPPTVITPAPSLPLAPPIPPGHEARPGNGGSLVSLFSTDDYPQAALRAGEQGTVAVRLLVTTDGRVGNCEVTSSSGSQTLDQATCSMLQRRARFTPARDQNGRPTIDYYTQRIRWEIPANILPFTDKTERIVLRFDDAGKISGCRFERDGQGVDLPECSGMEPLAKRVLTGRERQARGNSLVLERQFETNPTAGPVPKELGTRDVLLARGALEFDIDPSGLPRNCRALVREGDAAKGDICLDEGHLEFEPAAAGEAASRRLRFSFLSYLKPLVTGRKPTR